MMRIFFLIFFLKLTAFILVNFSDGTVAVRYSACAFVIVSVVAVFYAADASGINSLQKIIKWFHIYVRKKDRAAIVISLSAKIAHFVVLVTVTSVSMNMQKYEIYDATSNTSITIIGYKKGELPNPKYPEFSMVTIIMGYAMLGCLITYNVFYVQIMRSMKAAEWAAADLNFRNQKQKSLLSMKENDIKLLASSWKLNHDDVQWIRKVGEGATGSVWQGLLHDTWQVAIKIIKGEDGNEDSNSHFASLDDDDSSSAIARLQKEIQFCMRTRHSRLVMFVGWGQAPADEHHRRREFVVLEYMAGGELSLRVWSPQVVPTWQQRITWLSDVAEGLCFLHLHQKAVHRDIKSPNILLTAPQNGESRAKLADFNLAKIVSRGKKRYAQRKKAKRDDDGTKVSNAAALWTHKDMTTFCGTAAYMAPELLLASEDNFGNYGPQVDIYSFGIVMYETLALRKPWKESRALDIFTAVRDGRRPAVEKSKTDTAPKKFVKLMNSCTTQDPKCRPTIDLVQNTLKYDIYVADEGLLLGADEATKTEKTSGAEEESSKTRVSIGLVSLDIEDSLES